MSYVAGLHLRLLSRCVSIVVPPTFFSNELARQSMSSAPQPLSKVFSLGEIEGKRPNKGAGQSSKQFRLNEKTAHAAV